MSKSLSRVGAVWGRGEARRYLSRYPRGELAHELAAHPLSALGVSSRASDFPAHSSALGKFSGLPFLFPLAAALFVLALAALKAG